MELIQKRLNIREDEHLVDEFFAAAAANDRIPSLLIRDFMREYVKKQEQMDLIKKNKER